MAQLPARRRQSRALMNPFQEFEDIYDRMGQLMNAAFGGLGFDGGSRGMSAIPWSPLADISENDDAYVLEIELPGVRREDIDIQMQDRELAITGEVKESEQEGQQRRKGRRTGRFEYRAMLPSDVDAERVSARLADGVLKVTVPKSEKAKPRHIEVSA